MEKLRRLQMQLEVKEQNFKDKGEILAIDTKDNVHFDADISDHAHFICEKCGNVFDVISECSKCNILKNKRTKVGKISGYQIKFYGICNNCKQYKFNNKILWNQKIIMFVMIAEKQL